MGLTYVYAFQNFTSMSGVILQQTFALDVERMQMQC